jgi:peptidoglycan/LPS O-acetylase OafA/YrhL
MANYKKIYGLDGLRFFSFVFVILNHYYVILSSYGFNIAEPKWIDSLGHFGLQYFFCGSGFLISYMMLLEQDKNREFKISFFYLRRIFRIWPAYLFLVAIVYLFIYNSDYFYLYGMSGEFVNDKKNAFLFFVLMIPHLSEFFFSTAPYLNHTYTIGIEEQFYILWAVMNKYCRKYFFNLNLFILILGIFLNIIHYFFRIYFHQQHLNIINVIATYYDFSQFTTFALGTLLAFYYRSNHFTLQHFTKKWVQFIFYVCLSFCVYYNIHPAILGNEFLSFLMMFILLFASFKETSIFNFSYPLWEFLGKISYGVYLFHYIGLVITLKPLIQYFHFDMHNTFDYIVSIVLSLIVCTILGIISYYTIEKFFFKYKEKFTVQR